MRSLLALFTATLLTAPVVAQENDAEKLYREVIQLGGAAVGPGHPTVPSATRRLASLMLDLVREHGFKGLIAFTGGFHGRTFGSVSVTTSNINYRTGYEPLLPSVFIAPYPNVYRDFGGDEQAAIDGAMAGLRRIFAEEIAPSRVAGILIEPVQGEGGYYPAPPEFLRQLRAECDRYGILLIADEVQCGFARTGKMWGFEHAGIVPDVVCLAKAIANGLAILISPVVGL
jgi:4-aminobutyrate aminotransferase-like enzyme